MIPEIGQFALIVTLLLALPVAEEDRLHVALVVTEFDAVADSLDVGMSVLVTVTENVSLKEEVNESVADGVSVLLAEEEADSNAVAE